MQLFSLDGTMFPIFSTPFFKKNWPQELLIISPIPSFPQSSPDRSPQPRIDFPYYVFFFRTSHCSVIIGRNPIETKGKSDVTPYTGKSFSLYFKFL